MASSSHGTKNFSSENPFSQNSPNNLSPTVEESPPDNPEVASVMRQVTLNDLSKIAQAVQSTPLVPRRTVCHLSLRNFGRKVSSCFVRKKKKERTSKGTSKSSAMKKGPPSSAIRGPRSSNSSSHSSNAQAKIGRNSKKFENFVVSWPKEKMVEMTVPSTTTE